MGVCQHERFVSAAFARGTYVFRKFEMGSLLEGFALGPKPAVVGLGEELRTIDPSKLGSPAQGVSPLLSARTARPLC